VWRLRAPVSASEVRRIERWLATARVFLSLSMLVAVWIDPSQIRHSLWAYFLLTFYIIHGVVTMLLLRFRQRSTASFRLLVHSIDVIWPALMWPFAGPQGGMFLFFVFVLAAAAYRWGMWETAGTATAALALLWMESFAVRAGRLRDTSQWLSAHALPPLQAATADLEPNRLFMRSMYLLVMGLLLGYLAEQQKQLRAEKAVIAGVLGKARVEAGLTGTLHEIVGELVTLYGAKAALIASHEANSYRIFVGELHPKAQYSGAFHWREPDAADRDRYLFESEGDIGYAACKSRDDRRIHSLTVLDQHGDKVRDPSPAGLARLAEHDDFAGLMWVSFSLGHEWSGRIFLLDPQLTGDILEELRFLQDLVRQVGPAVYNVYLLRRLRLRAGAVERARFARELHDGAVQSLIAVEMQVDVLRRHAAGESRPLSEELSRIQGLLREEVIKLRELMQQMKSLDVDSRKLLGFFHDTVERFQRETGIAARFVTEVGEVDMPQQTCRELARIVQEGLVNVRKHSQAKHVLVRLGSFDGKWQVVIEDDGRGFPFSGRLSHAELEGGRKGPVVIKERLRLIDGELTIESNPGRGSRLEINIPQHREVAYG